MLQSIKIIAEALGRVVENTSIKSARKSRDRDVTRRRSPTGWRVDLRFPPSVVIDVNLN